MKIHFFGADYPPTGGGIATYSYEWIEALKHQSSIDETKMLMFGAQNNKRVFYIGYKTFLAFWNSRDCNIFHSFNLFSIGFWVVFWGKVFRKKTVVTFYGTDANDSSARKITLLLKKWTLKNATLAFTISEFTRQATEKKYRLPVNKIKVIYPVVPKILLSQAKKDTEQQVEIIKKTHEIKEDTFVVLSVARLVKRKGIEFTIRALKEINDKNIKFFVIGEGKEKDILNNLVEELKLKENVFILGRVDDVTPFYSLGHVATLVSYEINEDGDFEGLGLALIEAQSYGLPVIGSRSGGIPEAFKENVTGLVVKPRNVSDLAQAITRLKQDKSLTESLSKNTPIFLEERFGLKNTIERYIELCSTL